MLKKQYIQPSIKAYVIKPNTLLAGSVEVKSGSTNEQCAKSNPFSDFELGNDEE